MRISRSHPSKKMPVVYDIIYDHYMSFYQFSNNKEDCRMRAYNNGFVKIHQSNNLLIKFLNSRYKEKEMNYRDKIEWEKWKTKYVIDL